MRRILPAILIGFIFAIVLIAFSKLGYKENDFLYRAYTSIQTLESKNKVAYIYLNTRIFDTLFEALLLLVSVLSVKQFVVRNEKENIHLVENLNNEVVKNSYLMKIMIGYLYPIFILFGVYIVLNGQNSPGGGFQGGAIFACLVLLSYLKNNNTRFSYKNFEFIEKIMFLLILLAITIFKTVEISGITLSFYYILMNSLIAIKVCCGLIIIFLLFMEVNQNNEISNG